MGILSRFKKNKDRLDEPKFPEAESYQPAAPRSPTTTRAEIDLIVSHIDSLRIQYEAISSRLQNIERVVNEIRSFCR